MDLLEEFLTLTLAWAFLAGPVAAFCVCWWFLFVEKPRHILPPQRYRAVPWKGTEVLLVFLLMEILRVIVYATIEGVVGPIETEESMPYQSLAAVIAFPFFMTLSLKYMSAASETRLYQLGLHLGYWRRCLLLGCLAWLAATPLVHGVHFAAEWWLQTFFQQESEPHQLEQLVRSGDALIGWTLLIVLALVVAPLQEEFVFRGVIQRWAAPFGWRGHIILVFALLGSATNKEPIGCISFTALLLPGYYFCPLLFGWAFVRRDRYRRPSDSGDDLGSGAANQLRPFPNADSAKEFEPGESPPNADDAAAPLLQSPFLDWLKWQTAEMFNPALQDPRVNRPRAIYAAATLFACVHPWPTPIPLFFLGLILGWLAYRTQSLLAPVVLHVLFNGVAAITLALS